LQVFFSIIFEPLQNKGLRPHYIAILLTNEKHIFLCVQLTIFNDVLNC